MISCFPDPHPDEIFYSLCARFSDRVRYANKKSIFAELFGLRGIYPVVDLPCRLGYFVDNLIARDSYTVDYLLGRHTLEPFYGAFLPHKKRSE